MLSAMNHKKSKIRNNMKTDLLNAIINLVWIDQKGKVLYVLQTTRFSSKSYGSITSSTETSCSTVESTESSTTTIEMGDEEEDDFHFDF